MKGLLLIVDDDPTVLRATCSYLSHQGFVVNAVDDAAGAYALLAAKRYDCVITDLNLHGERIGLAIVAQVRSLPSRIPIVVMSGYASPSTREEAERRGADAFIEKPHSLLELERLLDRLLRGDPPGRTKVLEQIEG